MNIEFGILSICPWGWGVPWFSTQIYKVWLSWILISANVEHLLLIKTMIQGNCERTVNLPGLSYITDKIDKGPSMEVALCLFLLLTPSWAAVLQKRASQSELDMLNTIACIVPLKLVIVSKAYITRNLYFSNFNYLCIYVTFEGFEYLSILTAPHFDHGITIGHVNSHTVREESGLCASRRHTNILYTHNDSGDRARFYALDATTAHIKATLNVEGATSHDWEDIACGKSIHQ